MNTKNKARRLLVGIHCRGSQLAVFGLSLVFNKGVAAEYWGDADFRWESYGEIGLSQPEYMAEKFINVLLAGFLCSMMALNSPVAGNGMTLHGARTTSR